MSREYLKVWELFLVLAQAVGGMNVFHWAPSIQLETRLWFLFECHREAFKAMPVLSHQEKDRKSAIYYDILR